MRSNIAILVAVLASTVFLTSLVLESRNRPGNRASLGSRPRAVHAVPAGSQSLLGSSWPSDTVLLNAAPSEPAEARSAQLLAQAREFRTAGNNLAAREVWKSVLRADPAAREALAGLGGLSFDEKRYREAELYLGRLVELGPDDAPGARARLGVAQMRLGKYDAALENLESFLPLQPEDGALHFALACVHAMKGQTETALQHLATSYSILGLDLLAYISDPQLDSLRDTPAFKRIVESARERYRAAALPGA